VRTMVKAPYGQAMNAVTVLARAAARWQIRRGSFEPASAAQIRRFRAAGGQFERYQQAFDRLAAAHQIDWAA
jgi:primosomal protein N''